MDVNISYVSDCGVIQLKLCFNLKLVTAITQGQEYTLSESRPGAILIKGQRSILYTTPHNLDNTNSSNFHSQCY